MLQTRQLPESLRESVGRHFEQFQQTLDDSDLPALEQALNDQLESDAFAEQLTRAFGASEYLAKTCAAHPELLVEQVQSGELFRPLAEAGYTNLVEAVAECEDDEALDRTLRRQRHRAMVRLIWRDVNRLADTLETTAELSRLAETAIDQALAYHYRQLQETWGTPIGRDSGREQPFLVLGMGKLGAGELNLSSDVDLIYAFPEAGETQGGRRSTSNQEFFARLGQRLIKSLDARTVDGFVFRVDMRLRPYGADGALASNFDAMEDYYQSQGRDWERYAMVKARVVASVGEDAEHAAEQLQAMLRPFTYRQYIDFSVIESLREMKGLISRQVQRRGMHLDVKLGDGGIREVEFVVQVFQLIRGGRDPRMRERQVCKLLPLLEEEGYLPEGSGEALLKAYLFLRDTEHAIQAFKDKQTQALPEDDAGRERLAWVMGFADWEAFAGELESHRERVRAEFAEVIADPDEEQAVDSAALEDWRAIWEDSMDREAAEKRLSEAGFEEPERVLQLVRDLADGRQVKAMQAASRSRLDAFVPRLLAQLSEQARDDELPAGPAETLVRLVPLVESIVRRSAYLVLLVENPVALLQLVRLCAASPWIADQLTHHPALLDELLTPESLYAPPDKESLREELNRDLARLAWNDLEAHMDTLRHFRMAHGLRVAASEVTGALALMKVSDYLTDLAEVVLEHVLTLAWEQMVARHGHPCDSEGKPAGQPQFIVVGYGKLGGIELSHGSDLDLVFVHDGDPGGQTDGDKSLDNMTFYTRMGQRLIHILDTRMPSGKLYEVDMRLRPSGNAGMLVTPLSAFAKYQQGEAWTWEHQALVRARPVAGDPELAEQFAQVRREVLCQPREMDELRAEVVRMRQKMRQHLGSKGNGAAGEQRFHLKQDAGGIVDIEFMVQYAVLAWAHQCPELAEFTDNIRILGALEKAGLLAETSVGQLIEVYKTYRSTGHRLALQRREVVLEAEAPFAEERELVTGLWRELLEPDA